MPPKKKIIPPKASAAPPSTTNLPKKLDSTTPQKMDKTKELLDQIEGMKEEQKANVIKLSQLEEDIKLKCEEIKTLQDEKRQKEENEKSQIKNDLAEMMQQNEEVSNILKGNQKCLKKIASQFGIEDLSEEDNEGSLLGKRLRNASDTKNKRTKRDDNAQNPEENEEEPDDQEEDNDQKLRPKMINDIFKKAESKGCSPIAKVSNKCYEIGGKVKFEIKMIDGKLWAQSHQLIELSEFLDMFPRTGMDNKKKGSSRNEEEMESGNKKSQPMKTSKSPSLSVASSRGKRSTRSNKSLAENQEDDIDEDVVMEEPENAKKQGKNAPPKAASKAKDKVEGLPLADDTGIMEEEDEVMDGENEDDAIGDPDQLMMEEEEDEGDESSEWEEGDDEPKSKSKKNKRPSVKKTPPKKTSTKKEVSEEESASEEITIDKGNGKMQKTVKQTKTIRSKGREKIEEHKVVENTDINLVDETGEIEDMEDDVDDFMPEEEDLLESEIPAHISPNQTRTTKTTVKTIKQVKYPPAKKCPKGLSQEDIASSDSA